MTIPPSAAVGKRDRRERANSRTASTAAATASEYTWVWLPTVTAMAVLVPLLLTGKPCTSADAALATPSASSSRFGHDLLAAAGERTGGHHVVAEAHDQHGERGQQQLAQRSAG